MNQILKKVNIKSYIPLTLLCFIGAFYYLKDIETTLILFGLVILNHLSLVGIVSSISNTSNQPSHTRLYAYLFLKLVILGLILYYMRLNNQYLIAFAAIFMVQVGILTISLKKN